jgi:hypothetical protein
MFLLFDFQLLPELFWEEMPTGSIIVSVVATKFIVSSRIIKW